MKMSTNLKESAQKIQEKLYEKGYDIQVMELPSSTRTVREAADSIGCDVAQIAKSIVFRLEGTDTPLLVVASGINRIDDKRLGKELGKTLGKADANFVRKQ